MKHRILFAEDEKILGQLVTEALRKEGFDVHHVSNGSQIQLAYREYRPHLCLLDVMLPGKDGFEVTRQIRSVDKNIPIILLTAKIQTGDLVKGFDAGCNDYIRKPFSMGEVVVRINSWLKEKYGIAQPGEPDEIPIGAFVFMPARLELRTPDDIVITLTYKDAAILSLLYRHRNNVVSRDDLLHKVWGDNSLYHSRTLDVYINRIRKYFSKSPNTIITLKGVGYRFICG